MKDMNIAHHTHNKRFYVTCMHFRNYTKTWIIVALLGELNTHVKQLYENLFILHTNTHTHIHSIQFIGFRQIPYFENFTSAPNLLYGQIIRWY